MLTPSLDLTQNLGLVMTAQMRQAIALLQATNLEVAAYLSEQALTNPLLELGAPDHLVEMRSDGATPSIDQPLADGHAPDAGAATNEDWDEAPYHTARQFDDDEAPQDRIAASGPALQAQIAEQIALNFRTPRERLIASHLLSLLDDAGRLSHTLLELAEALGVALAELEAIRTILLQCDPPGLFAFSLAECLEAQLRARNRFDPAMAALLANLDLLAARDLRGLRLKCGVDAEDLAEMIAELRELDPKPGHMPDMAAISVVPDVWIKTHGAGFRCALNGASLPHVAVNDTLRRNLASRDKTARAYLTERAAHAAWIVKAVETRTSSLLQVTRAIVERQAPFLHGGIAELRPMTLRNIAEDTGLHESTVSRITANTYAATPRGTLALRFFFSVAIASSGEETQSAEAVRHRIRKMITEEPADGVLSDDAIAARLQETGLSIMRRTVAKYREAMGIATSAQRKREKRAGLR